MFWYLSLDEVAVFSYKRNLNQSVPSVLKVGTAIEIKLCTQLLPSYDAVRRRIAYTRVAQC
jgi:hypothetical protein